MNSLGVVLIVITMVSVLVFRDRAQYNDDDDGQVADASRGQAIRSPNDLHA